MNLPSLSKFFSKSKLSDSDEDYTNSELSLNLRGKPLLSIPLESSLRALLTSHTNVHVTLLDISYCTVDQSSFTALCTCLPLLKELSASSCQLDDNICYHMQDWPLYLKKVNLSRNLLQRCPKYIAGLKYLSYLNLSGNSIIEVDTDLLRLPNLTRLLFINNPIRNISKDICRKGVTTMQEYFQIFPNDTNMLTDGVQIKPQQRLPSTDSTSGYLSCPSLTSVESISSTSSLSPSPTPPNKFDQFACPEGYTGILVKGMCQVFVPKDQMDERVTVSVIHDSSLHPPVRHNQLLVTPVVSIEPHGRKFSCSHPAMIVLPHCTTIDQTDVSFVPMCSNTSGRELPQWQRCPELDIEIYEECVVVFTTHFSLFAAVTMWNYPYSTVDVTPDAGGTVSIQEFSKFELVIPPNAVDQTTTFKATVLYCDPWYHSEREEAEHCLASACIALEPHGLVLNKPVKVQLPIVNYYKIRNTFLDAAQLLLLTAQDTDNSLTWIALRDHELTVSNDGIATFSINHFSFFKVVWTISVESMKKLGNSALYAYKYIRTRAHYIGIRCQVFMSPPSPVTLTFPLLVAIFKFGEPLKVPCNYKWMLADTGERRCMIKTGEVSILLTGYFFKTVKKEEKELLREFSGQDFCLEAEYRVHLDKQVQLPIADYEVIGELSLIQQSEDKVCFKRLLIKPPELHVVGDGTRHPVCNQMTPPKTPLLTAHEDISYTMTPQSDDKRKSIKRCLLIKQGQITSDSDLMDVAQDIGCYWERLHPYLHVPYGFSESIVAQHRGQQPEILAYHMLQRWRSYAGDKCNYTNLRVALEKIGLQTIAQKHCYEFSVDKTQ